MVEDPLNWLNWFHFLILMAGPLIIISCVMCLLQLYHHIISMFMLTVSFLQLEPGIVCLHNPFIWSMISVALSLELIDTFFLWLLSKELSCMFFIFFFLLWLHALQWLSSLTWSESQSKKAFKLLLEPGSVHNWHQSLR